MHAFFQEEIYGEQAFSDKPIVAIIYPHHHYTGGTQPIVEEGGGKNVAIFGHPALDRNLQSTAGASGPMQFRRVAIRR